MPEKKPITCKKCKAQNPGLAMYCQNCGHVLHPHKRRMKRLFRWFIWLGAIIIVLFIPLAIYSVKQNKQAQKIDITVSSPATVRVQEAFAYTVTVTNKGDRTTQLIGLALDQALIKENGEAAFALSADRTTPPAYTNRDSRSQLIIYYPKYSLAPGQALVFSVGLQALRAGEFSGRINALNGFGSASPAQDVSIKVIAQ